MSEYIVTARKWRPMRFDDVAGQRHVTVTLRNAIATGRLAHAYLFSGPRGVGKTTTARLLAKAVNCDAPVGAEPDNSCENCREITEGRSFDVLEIDGASNRGVEEIRNLREAVRYAPAKARYKVYIIDEVHMLTKEAFNALLKTLEEPPAHILFIFATTEIHKIPPTILSRCQRFDFRRIALEEIISNLKTIAAKEGLKLEEDALLLIAKKGDGSLRDAQSLFDQIVSLCGKTEITLKEIVQALNIVDQELFFRLTDLIKGKDAKGGLHLVQEIMDRGYDIREFLAGLTEHFRNILTVVTTGSTELVEESDTLKKRYKEIAQYFSATEILRLLKFTGATETAIRWSPHPRFKLETDIVQMINMPGAADVGEVLQKLDDLKKKLDYNSPEGSERHPALSSFEAVSSGEDAGRTPSTRSSQKAPLVRTNGEVRPDARSGVEPVGNAAPGLDEGEVRSRWVEFVSEVRRQRISLGSVLESSSMAGVHGNMIRIYCGNDFQASSIKRNRELISKALESVFHRTLGIEVEINHFADRASGSPVAAESSLSEEHPIVKAIIKELGAEPL